MFFLLAGAGYGHSAAPEIIAVRQHPQVLESLAAQEVRRYVYLRTGKLMQVKQGATGGDRIVVACKTGPLCGKLGRDLEPQQFLLKSDTVDGHRVWWREFDADH